MEISKVMQSILRRVLNEERGRQNAWSINENSDRSRLIVEIEEFMQMNGIELDDDHYYNGYYQELRG